MGRVAAPGEPRWLPEDRAKIIAYAMERSLHCTMCGTSSWQWEEDPDAFEAIAVTCPGCQRRDWAREDQPEMGQQAGVSVTLVSRARAEQIRDTPKRAPRRRRRR